jgi:integrase
MDAKGWNPNTKNDFASAVQRAFNWAVKQGIIDRNPVAYIEKPAREARELAISPKDYAEVMAAVTEPNFRTLLELAWETGARVQELRKIEARFFDAANGRIVFPPREAKGKKHHRVIYLGSDRARQVVAELSAAHPVGPILLNSEGRPWTKDAINCAFCRLKKKLGRKLHLGAWRKGFATEALKAGIDTVTVAALLGHQDGTMVSRVYGRVQQDPEYMAKAARRAKGG